MSTKIYNGYKLPKLSLNQLHDFCMQLRKDMQIVMFDEMRRLESTAAVKLLDIVCVNKTQKYPKLEHIEYKDESSFLCAARNFTIGQMLESQKSNMRDAMYDLSFNITLHPLSDCILCVVFGQNKAILNRWEKYGFAEYGYWDNSDEPEEVTENEWRTRKSEWEIALPEDECHSIPALCGFTVECWNNMFMYMLNEQYNKHILKHVPKIKNRVQEIANEIVFEDFSKNYGTVKKHWLDDAEEWQNYKETEKYRKDIQSIKDELKQILINPITTNILQQDIRSM